MDTDLSTILTGLRAGKLALPWPERRRLLARLAEVLAQRPAYSTALELVHLLAHDPKWEVRSDVAELLLLVPETDFIRLAAMLSEDPNEYVRQAAHRALDRWHKGQRHIEGLSADAHHLRSRWEAFGRRHGHRAVAQARRIADTQFDHLVGAAVHQMRNVLTPLKAGVASMRKRLDEAGVRVADLRRTADKAAAQIGFLERLLDDMRSFSQPLPTRRRRERLLPVLQEAIDLAQESLVGTGRDASAVSVRIDVPEAIVLEAARRRIVGAMANVVKNAIEAYSTGPDTFRAGEVRVAARLNGDDRIEITVEDQGLGIAPEDLEDLRQFVPGKTTKRRSQGTGFGLPIAERNIRAHGGRLSIASATGRGTTVTIMLPVHQQGGDEAWPPIEP